MLQFVLGGSKTGKSSWITHQLAELAGGAESAEKIFLIVPEQFTFETEKDLFGRLGGDLFRRINVTSFSRIGDEIFRVCGGGAGQYAGDCAKRILMERAVEELRDELEIYRKSAKGRNFPALLLDTVSEFKNAGVTPVALSACAELLPEGALRQKARETALLYAAYDALLQQTYLDPLDNLSRAAALAQASGFFKGSVVFFDGFKGFTAVETELIRLILQQGESSCFSLCIDRERMGNGKTGLFASQTELYNRLIRLGRQCGASVKTPVWLDEPHFTAPELCHMEKNLFSPRIEPFSGECGAIRAVLCDNEYDEADYALSALLELVQDEGCRYGEIAVISRDMETYLPRLEAAFAKYGVPYYSDREEPVENKPLIRFVKNALACVTDGMTGENVLAFLKCGLSPFSVEEVAELENYVFIWDVSGKQWGGEFTQNPRGFREELTEEDAAALARINRLRGYAAERLSAFRDAVSDAGGRDICAAVVDFLDYSGAREALERRIGEFYAAGDFTQSEEYARVWDILMGMLDEIAAAAGTRPASPAQFALYFSLAASAGGMGVLPQTLDSVTVGAADRIRVRDKRAVLLLGVNEGVLPCTPSGGGLFTDREREQLAGLSPDIAKPTQDKLREEQFIAYQALCLPAGRLILTARKSDIAGEMKAPSVLFSQLAKMFGESVITESADLPGEYFCRAGGAAFSCLAKRYLDDTELTATLKNVLSENGCAGRLKELDRILENRSFSIQNRKNATALFGRDLRLSPTRVESYYQCRFRYFMEQGIRAFPLKKAELDPLETGTLIHKVLFSVTRQLDLKENYDRELAKKLIKQELDEYIFSVMGGVKEKSSRFLYLYQRMRLSILKVVEHLHLELLQSRFSPCDFEYEIADGAEITPLRLMGGDGAEIALSGKIDRVDSYTDSQGEKYIRIVDYKSGGKSFRLNDVLYGLNLQMLIYLRCISQNGTGRYEHALPAGILYMPAGEQPPSLPRDADSEAVSRQKLKGYAMNGLILADREIVEAMDSTLSGVFIPVSCNKDGSFAKNCEESLVTLTELGKINAYIDRLVVNMARELHEGRVEALPLEGSCIYCGYRGVCGVTRASEVKRYCEMDREALFRAFAESDEKEAEPLAEA